MVRNAFLLRLGAVLIALCWAISFVNSPALAAPNQNKWSAKALKEKFVAHAQRKVAAKHAKAAGMLPGVAATGQAMMEPGGIPHYFGPYPNYAYSPMPTGPVTSIVIEEEGEDYTTPTITIRDVYGTGSGATAEAVVDGGAIKSINITNGGSGYTAPIVVIEDPTGKDAVASATIGGTLSGGIRKFVDALPSLPVAVPDTTTYPGSDYYEIELREYSAKMHSDLPPTRLRGYVQVKNGVDVAPIQYLGPVILARRDRPVRVKFTNKLPTGAGGNLFIPVDTTVMGAGMGPLDMPGMEGMKEMYTQNRATVHLHGNNTVWISDGTPHQWVTPANEDTQYPKGVSVYNVPDMPDPGPGSLTFYYTNQQSARLMFYHDHAYGITRLNVYAGEAAGYVLTDDVEDDMILGTNDTGVNPTNARVLPDLGIPLVIQDKTFVDASTIAAQDPTWSWGAMPGMPMTGDLWMPHVYMPNQNPGDIGGMNAFGRWHYGPWFWPPTNNIEHGPVPNPYYGTAPWEPALMPGVPHPSMAMEAFMDTPVVNGVAYPYLEVDPKAYRFRILNAADDRFFNLQLYVADPNVITSDNRTDTEVKMVSAIATKGYPASWPTDGREGGVPDPLTMGPPFIQIGTEGGFLPMPVVVQNQPVTWNLDQTNFDFGVVKDHALLLGTAERADVIIDFSQYRGKTLILYNDSPAPFPALDPRYDYYTGHPDQTDVGGTPTTQPGFGPNTRTIMQIRVRDVEPAAPYDLNLLRSVFAKTDTKRGVFEVSQDEIIVPTDVYNMAYNNEFPSDQYVRIYDHSKTFTTIAGNTVTIPLQPKAIQDEMGEAFDKEYGRMSGFLGLELPKTAALLQDFVLYPYPSPPVDIITPSITGTQIGSLDDGTQIWKITHNGVDTHTIHTHLFNAQIINRVAWDNAIRLPDPNELGWKETFRVNPLQDTIIALRPVKPEVPFQVPNSVRLIDPTMPEGAILYMEDEIFDPAGEPIIDPIAGAPVSIVNHYVNFGWEYVWHCHLLSHEEMDMMHSLVFAVAPEAPTNLAASRHGSRVRLSWTDNSLTETGFVVQRADDAAFSAGLVSFTVSANVVGYEDTTITPNQTCFYRVYAVNTVGDTRAYTGDPEVIGFPTVTRVSGYSNTAIVGQVVLPPAAPTNLTAALQNGPQISLTWTDNANNETGFEIERSVNGGAFTQIATRGPRNGTGGASYSDATVTAGNTYGYRVRAVNSGGSSDWSNIASVTIPGSQPPAAPTNLAAVLQAGPQVLLTWTDNANNETGFQIERSVNGGTFTQIAAPAADSTSYTDTTVTAGNTYNYRVRAVNAAGPSGYSNTANIVIPGAQVPAAPTNLAATARRVGNGRNDRVALTWTDNANNETNFTIERATDAGFTANLVSVTLGANSTTYETPNVPRNTTFWFRVRALNAAGSSGWSNVVSILTP